MRKPITALLVTCLLASAFNGCRKGEDDPAFSLRSRKGRLNGSWTLQEGKLKISVTQDGQAAGEHRYQFTDKNYVLDVAGSGAHFEGTSDLSLEFDRKGGFRMKQKMDSISLSANGQWDFLGAVGDDKSKEKILIELDKIEGSSVRFNTFNKSYAQFKYRIRELRKERLVLVSENELIDGEGSLRLYVDCEYIFKR